MKKFPLALLLLLPLLTYAQNEEETSDRYIRNSISVLFVEYGDAYDASLSRFYQHASVSNRFDINQIGLKSLRLNVGRQYAATSLNGDKILCTPDRTTLLTEQLNKAHAGRQILAYLFNRQENGFMDLSRIEARGEYTAHDVDITLSNSLKVGMAKVRDEGINLIQRSYILVFDNANLRKEYKGKDDSRELYWSATSSAYLFKICFDEEKLYWFYDHCWLDQNTPAEEVAARKAAFEGWDIPVECVQKEDCNLSKSTNIEMTKRLNLKGTTSDQERLAKTYEKLISETFNSLTFNIEKRNEDFTLKIPITNTAPIRAKIGSKEGVSNGLCFYVYSNRGKADGSVVAERRGVIRATNKIADNRQVASGNSLESEFVKIAGYRSIDEGMTLQEKKDLKMGVNLGIGSSTLLQAEATYLLSIHRFTSSYAHVGLGYRGSFSCFYGALGWGIHIPNLEIYPYIGYGVDSYGHNNDDEDESLYSAQFIQYGLRANLAISHPIYIFAGTEINSVFSRGSVYRRHETDFNTIDGLNISMGVRICF